MRTARSLPLVRGLGLALRQGGAWLREGLALSAVVALLEWTGRYAVDDKADMVVCLGLVVLAVLLGQAARGGWMPVTRRVVVVLVARGRSLVRRISPRYAVAFRAAPGARALPDRSLAWFVLLALCLVGAQTALGGLVLDGLAWVKRDVSYTLYLAGLMAVWSTLFLTTVFSAIAAQQSLRAAGRGRASARRAYLNFGALWIAGLVVLVLVPGIWAAALVLALGAWGARALRAAPAQDYLFCRRDERGRAHAVPVQAYLRQLHALIVLGLAFVALLGQSQRLWQASWPTGRFALTGWFGLMAGLAAVLLVWRVSAHFLKLVGGSGVQPELPPTPTLWIRTPVARDLADPAARQEAAWWRIARESGWLVLRGPEAPTLEHDLVLGQASGPRRFEPREPLDDDDARIQLERRYHVVARRRFHRCFEALFKRLKGESREGGTGYLFCPHAWLVPGVVRDVESRKRRQAGGALAGPTIYGPPYAQAFPLRVRRYVGSVLRPLAIDILFWEDAITWTDLRRVLAACYEVHDQRRGPIQERHFTGIPRVRVVLQEEAAEADGPAVIPAGEVGELPDPAPGHARILLVLRERGQQDEVLDPEPAGHGIRTPSLV